MAQCFKAFFMTTKFPQDFMTVVTLILLNNLKNVVSSSDKQKP